MFAFGLNGFFNGIIPDSCGVREPFFWLHFIHAATKFSQVFFPPRDFGSTWSIVRYLKRDPRCLRVSCSSSIESHLCPKRGHRGRTRSSPFRSSVWADRVPWGSQTSWIGPRRRSWRARVGCILARGRGSIWAIGCRPLYRCWATTCRRWRRRGLRNIQGWC